MIIRAPHVASWLAFAAIVGVGSLAEALPTVGDALPDLRLSDGWGRTLDLSQLASEPVLVIYEDKASSRQNVDLKRDLAVLAKADRYKQGVALVAIANVEGYDYWPVRGFVKDAINDEARKFDTPIYCDWDGTARRELGVNLGVSNVILYARGGKVLFSHEGKLAPGQRQEILGLLRREVER